MPIEHTVVFSLVHEAGSAAEREFLETGRATLTAIPGVRDFAISRQVSPKSSFAFRFGMVFDDQAAYDAYNAHPAHVAFVADRWAHEVSDFQEFDFEPA